LIPPEMRRAASAVVQRDDGLWSIGWHDEAPGPFNSRLDALRIATGEKPASIRNDVGGKFRRLRVAREVLDA
jgi:hypothetical protein